MHLLFVVRSIDNTSEQEKYKLGSKWRHRQRKRITSIFFHCCLKFSVSHSRCFAFPQTARNLTEERYSECARCVSNENWANEAIQRSHRRQCEKHYKLNVMHWLSSAIYVTDLCIATLAESERSEFYGFKTIDNVTLTPKYELWQSVSTIGLLRVRLLTSEYRTTND